MDLDLTISVLTVFIQGIISFFSPCVLPIVPLYLSYLSGNDNEKKQKTMIINTISFIIGISGAFFILGLGFSTLGKYFNDNAMIFSRVGGIVVILLGLIQLGWLDKPFKGKDVRLPIKLNLLKMNPVIAFIMGFTFSFAWTPCVGPALSTVLIMASSSKTMATGMMLIGVYTLGFTIPFLIVGIFTTKVLDLLKKHMNVVNYVAKLGGILMILMGVMMYTGIMNSVSGYLSSFGENTYKQEDTQKEDSKKEDSKKEENSENNEVGNNSSQDKEEKDVVKAIDFELKDQNGVVHKLSDYKGKVVFLNFWATWCPPCKEEMPDIQKLYEEYGYNKEDVVILGVAFPSGENVNTQEQDVEGVTEFLEENNYTYPTVMDTEGTLTQSYMINAFPTTFMIDVEGNVFGYVPGMLTYDIMENIIKQTIESK